MPRPYPLLDVKVAEKRSRYPVGPARLSSNPSSEKGITTNRRDATSFSSLQGRVDIHLIQISAQTRAGIALKARGVWS